MQNSFAILGAGMQGTAAAYDLAKYAAPAEVILGDYSLEQAQKSADRVNGLLNTNVCRALQIDALDHASLVEALTTVDVVISCVPYYMHPQVAKAAIESLTDMVDLGGNTEITMKTLELDEEAKEAGISLVPDTGLAPGLVNNIGSYLLETLDSAESVKLYCGVLPQNPKPPFNYKVTFNVEGLVTEYDYQAVVLRDGDIVMVDTLTEIEHLHIDELGEMEAFVTSGGTSTAPYTHQGSVTNYEYKTIRHPGHAEKMRLYKDFGLWREDTIKVKGTEVRPKDVFNVVFGEELAKFEDKDLCAVRGVGVGQIGGKPATVQVDIFDKEDDETGFTSMERLTGFSTSIIAQHVANGEVPDGAIRYENAMGGGEFLQELEKRGVKISKRVCQTQ